MGSVQPPDAPAESVAVSAAQKARAERNRQKARALREARLVQQPQSAEGGAAVGPVGAVRALLSGGGFLLEEGQGGEAPRRRAEPPAPVPHRADQPHCLHCERPFPHSYLFDTFDYSVCDECRSVPPSQLGHLLSTPQGESGKEGLRAKETPVIEPPNRDDEDAHSLITRTEAKSEFLLKDCDLDLRPPALRCVRRRNPHRARFAEMRLYLRAQVERRALDVWGSREALEAELRARRERQARAAAAAERRRLRALRMDVRSSLFDRTHAAHEHAFGPERYDADADAYSRACACGYVDTYEKM